MNDEGDGSGVARSRNLHFEQNGVKNQMKILVSLVNLLCCQNDDLKNELLLFKQCNNTMMKQINSSIKRLTMLPVSRAFSASICIINHSNTTTRGGTQHTSTVSGDSASGSNDNDDGISVYCIAYETTLSKCPRSLYILLQEYQFDIGGRKPARLFTSEERGRLNFNYSLRKHF